MPENFVELNDYDDVNFNIESEALEHLIDQRLVDVAEENYNLLRTIDSLGIVYETYNEMLSKDVVSLEDINNFKRMINLSLAGTDVVAGDVFSNLVSVESITEPKLALEEIGGKLFEKIKEALERSVKRNIQNNDTVTLVNSYFDFQKKRISKIEKKLSEIDDKQVEVRISPNSNMTYGHRQIVKNADEYKNKFNESINVLVEFLGEMGSFIKDDMGSSIKLLLSPVTGYKKAFIENYNKIKIFIKSIASKEKMHEVIIKDEVAYYSTDILLGEYSIKCNIPIQELKEDDVNIEHKKLYKLFNLDFIRSVQPVAGYDKINLDLNKNDIKQILDTAKKMNEAYREYSSFVNRLSVSFSTRNISLGLGSPAIILMIFSNFRMLIKLSDLIHSNSGSAFVISKLQTKNALSICEKYIKQRV